MSFFPDQKYEDVGAYADAYLSLVGQGAAAVDRAALAEAGRLLADCVAKNKTIFSCGNGGSAAVANHLVCDCLKGIRPGTSIKPRVHSLSSSFELMTAIANDLGFEQIFAYPLESLGSTGDVLVVISSSGASPNILRVLETAHGLGMKTIAMTGFSGGDAAKRADVSLHVPVENYGVVEDVHQSLMHILAQYMRHTHLDDPSTLGSVKF